MTKECLMTNDEARTETCSTSCSRRDSSREGWVPPRPTYPLSPRDRQMRRRGCLSPGNGFAPTSSGGHARPEKKWAGVEVRAGLASALPILDPRRVFRGHSSLDIRHSFVISHSSFVIPPERKRVAV